MWVTSHTHCLFKVINLTILTSQLKDTFFQSHIFKNIHNRVIISFEYVQPLPELFTLFICFVDDRWSKVYIEGFIVNIH